MENYCKIFTYCFDQVCFQVLLFFYKCTYYQTEFELSVINWGLPFTYVITVWVKFSITDLTWDCICMIPGDD